MPVVDEFPIGRHTVFGRFLVVSFMFALAALEVVSRAYLENIVSVCADIMADI